MENQIFELQYAIDTFYFLICGALVMWMAAGFSMLEAGLVRSKNTAEILTKNVALFAVACTMYLIVGYYLMYGGGLFLAGIAGGETAGGRRPGRVRRRMASTAIRSIPVPPTSSSRWCSWPPPCPSSPVPWPSA